VFFPEIDLNGMDNMGDDSDSVGNAPRTTRSAPGGGGGGGGGAGFTLPTKEKRKPFFKKVSIVSSIFIALGYARAQVTPSVCLSVCLSHAGSL